MKKSLVIILLLVMQLTLTGQPRPFVSHPSQLNDDSFAQWIGPGGDIGLYFFRKTFELTNVPATFTVHVSADERYELFVNGVRVCRGPAVGDIENWHYETVDLAPYLTIGKNLVAAQVWSKGRNRGARQISNRLAFIMQGNTHTEQILNTNQSWKVTRNPGYFTLPMNSEMAGGGFIAGGTDSLIASDHLWDWNLISFDDSDWSVANELGKGNHTGLDTWLGTPWKLKPRTFPFLEEKTEPTPQLLVVFGLSDSSIKPDKFPVEIPANTRVEILLDNKVITMGYPHLLVSGGEGSHVQIQYQEALFDENGQKQNRNQWEGMAMKGIYDVFLPDGKERIFQPLWIRVFRYVKITVETSDQPITLENFYNRSVGYPLQQNASFDAGIPYLKPIWDASWRTQRLCALEGYWDCPYYEQVQYIGDTRIQALITMYVDGDHRLARNAIEQFYNSMQPMGLTKSAHPTGGVQIIPPFSLVFIGMVHDYYMLRNDHEFVRQYVPGINFILEWFISRIDENGILGPLPYWNHIDGGTDFINGSPPGISDGGSAHITLLLSYALDKAVEMHRAFGYDCEAERYSEISRSLKEKTVELCFDPVKGLIAETPSKRQFSQHTNVFGVLTDAIDTQNQQEVMQRVLDDKSLIHTTLYFKYYLFQALKKVGMGEQVLALMDEWKYFIDMGFSTFPEHGLHSRSDCHAWAAHPMYAFLNVFCGIEPGLPGFETVLIKPDCELFPYVNASMPHPKGEIRFVYQKDAQNSYSYSIALPLGLTGKFVLGDREFDLMEGLNLIKSEN